MFVHMHFNIKLFNFFKKGKFLITFSKKELFLSNVLNNNVSRSRYCKSDTSKFTVLKENGNTYNEKTFLSA